MNRSISGHFQITYGSQRTYPKPRLSISFMTTPSLSKPAANPIQLGKARFLIFLLLFIDALKGSELKSTEKDSTDDGRKRGV
mmetsp:Transcript_5033/g.6653  ORF Transcript_5033/g.6653 Transcript_5033/m.6653 type:complete len:82 (-) Transcript_5033:307-552(-)